MSNFLIRSRSWAENLRKWTPHRCSLSFAPSVSSWVWTVLCKVCPTVLHSSCVPLQRILCCWFCSNTQNMPVGVFTGVHLRGTFGPFLLLEWTVCWCSYIYKPSNCSGRCIASSFYSCVSCLIFALETIQLYRDGQMNLPGRSAMELHGIAAWELFTTPVHARLYMRLQTNGPRKLLLFFDVMQYTFLEL